MLSISTGQLNIYTKFYKAIFILHLTYIKDVINDFFLYCIVAYIPWNERYSLEKFIVCFFIVHFVLSYVMKILKVW